VGCGDGKLSSELIRLRPDLRIQGIDLRRAADAPTYCSVYDGRRIPHEPHAFDVVQLVDVLHHAQDPIALLRECRRVTKSLIIVKDHLCRGAMDRSILAWMDKIGNARYGVPLYYEYWNKTRWKKAFETVGMGIATWDERLNLYPWPLNLVGDRNLHFISKLKKSH
jgi:SAM-dependent methyltransferase